MALQARQLIAPLIAIALCTCAVHWLPRSKPVPANYTQAEALVSGRPVEPHEFLPAGYTCLLFGCAKVCGLENYPYLHGIFYLVGLLAVVWATRLLHLSTRWSVAAVTLVAVHPYWIVNIVRVIDNAVVTPLIALLYGLLVWRDSSWKKTAFLGLTSGLLVSIRPNLLSLLPLVVASIVLDIRASGMRLLVVPAVLRLTLCLAAIFATTVLANLATHQRLFFVPNNGAYNLYAGANPFSQEYLATRYNAEYSLIPALKQRGLVSDRTDVFDLQQPTWRPILEGLAKDFILEHPTEYFGLSGLKFGTLFRPDFRLAHKSSRVMTVLVKAAQSILVLPALAWSVACLLCWLKQKPVDIKAIALVLLYTIPFVLTNADPRFRLPLDAVFILAGARCAQELLQAKGHTEPPTMRA